MGQKMTTSSYRPPKGEEMNRNRFDFLNIIGRGGFGKVWKVIDKKYKSSFALKEMQKLKVIDKKSENSIKYERELLSRLKHPFIVNMYYAFQDYDNLYLVMDLLNGGDLRYHVSRHRRFSEEQTKFFIACIVTALEYIHSKSVIHRDIKPENLVLDDKGYVRITDFGIAKVFSLKNANETSGTPGYMSPEVMRAQNHTFAVDYFAVGIIGHEFMLGKRPYVGKTRKEIKEQMMAKQAVIKEEDIPQGWSIESADFINKLMQRKPELRLGYNGAFEIKEHPWLKNYPWNELYNKKLRSPFIPEKRDNYDKRYCEAIEKLGIDTKGRYDQYKSNQRYEYAFQNFTFYNIETEEIKHEYEQSKNSLSQYEKVQYDKPYDISKKRCQSAIGFNPRERDPIEDRENCPPNYELKKANSKANIFTGKIQHEQVLNSPMNSNTLKYSSSSTYLGIMNNNNGSQSNIHTNNASNRNTHSHTHLNSNGIPIQKAKTINANNNSQYISIQNKIPVPMGTNRQFIRSISNICSSPYSNPKKKTIEETSSSSMSILKSSNAYRTHKNGEVIKHARTGSLIGTPSNNTIIKMPIGLQRSNSNLGIYTMKNNTSYNSNGSFSQINSGNGQTTYDSKSNINAQRIMSNININEKYKKGKLVSNTNSSSAALFKNYKMSCCSSNSTGTSSSSKIIR